MADLQVDDHVLAESELRLARLHSEFRHLDDQRDHLHALWGAGAFADAMDDFFDNWVRYRKKLISGIEAVGTLVSETRSTFREVDERLARGGRAHGTAAGAGR
jgi:hypothetical protein